MGKKQRRMEKDPNAKQRGKPDAPKVVTGKLKIEGTLDTGAWSRDAQKLQASIMEEAQRAAKDFIFSEDPNNPGGSEPPEHFNARGILFGGTGPKISQSGGRIFVDGEEFKAQRQGFDTSAMMAKLLKMYDVPAHMFDEGDKMPEEQVASSILAIAVQIWEHPLDWQFMVGHNPGQMSYWFTAKFYDNEEGIVLAKGTAVITEEMLVRTTLDEAQLHIERQLATLHDNLAADLSAFEED